LLSTLAKSLCSYTTSQPRPSSRTCRCSQRTAQLATARLLQIPQRRLAPVGHKICAMKALASYTGATSRTPIRCATSILHSIQEQAPLHQHRRFTSRNASAKLKYSSLHSSIACSYCKIPGFSTTDLCGAGQLLGHSQKRRWPSGYLCACTPAQLHTPRCSSRRRTSQIHPTAHAQSLLRW
jgi:hypothetical protein